MKIAGMIPAMQRSSFSDDFLTALSLSFHQQALKRSDRKFR
jgi:hypothetical protein